MLLPICPEKVFINKTQFFANVQEDVWNYWIGGHQIAQKWIKERKGEVLSESDVANYCNIVGIINETIKVIKKIDEVIEL